MLIACGTRPFRPDYVPFNGVNVLDSDEIVDLKKLPRSLAVIGAGVIGVEYATIFSALDVAVTLIEPRPSFLDFIDKELIEEFVHDLRDRNVALRLGSAVNLDQAERGGQPVVALANGRNVESRDAAVRGRPGRRDRPRSISRPPASQWTIAAGSRSIRRRYKPRRRISMPPATSSASRASPRPRWSRAASPPVTPRDGADGPRPNSFPMASIPSRDLDRRHDRGRSGTREIAYEVGVARFRETSRGHIMGFNCGMMKMIFSTKTRRLLGVHISAKARPN